MPKTLTAPVKKRPVSFGKVAKLAAADAAKLAADLETGTSLSDEQIHRIRVFFKKLRALVHMGRGVMRKRERREWNTRIQKAARGLSAARDGVVLAGWLEKACAAQDSMTDAEKAAFLELLGNGYPRRLPRGARDAVLDVLHAVANEWPSSLGKLTKHPKIGLQFMRNSAREEALEAISDRHPETWHSWRRRVKYVAYQVEWLARAQKKEPGVDYTRWRRLGSALGKMNDMHNLEHWIERAAQSLSWSETLRNWAKDGAEGYAKNALKLAKNWHKRG